MTNEHARSDENKPKVCRRLNFDDLPAENVTDEKAQELEELEEEVDVPKTEMKKEVDRLSKQYNFDFVNGVPLEGDYEWVPVNEELINNSSSSSQGQTGVENRQLQQ